MHHVLDMKISVDMQRHNEHHFVLKMVQTDVQKNNFYVLQYFELTD